MVSELINISIQQLTQITNQNAASSEEMSANAEQLSAQAQQLNNLISDLETADDKNFKSKNTNYRKSRKKRQEITETRTSKNEGFNLNLSKKNTKDDEFEEFLNSKRIFGKIIINDQIN